MAGLKQIMEIFMTINQPLSSEQRVRWYIQRGLQRFFMQILKSQKPTHPKCPKNKTKSSEINRFQRDFGAADQI